MKNTMEDIIDLTDVVSVGNGVNHSSENAGFGTNHGFAEENDVLDSLVSDFERNEAENDREDEALDLSNLDNLISSYNLNFDEDTADNADNADNAEDTLNIPFEQTQNFENMQLENDTKLENDFDAIFNDIKNDIEDEDSFAGQGQATQILFDEELDTLEKSNTDEADKDFDEIDLLTQDIIGGAENKQAAQMHKIQSYSQYMTDDENIVHMQETTQENEWNTFDREFEKIEDSVHLSNQKMSAANMDHADNSFDPDSMNDTLKSDMAEVELDDINDEAFSNILNELSVEHEHDEEVVSFAQEANTENTPIHLHGNVNFLENGKTENQEDINLVQSASKILDSDEAYLEKFNDEDDSLSAKVKKLFIGIASLEQRVNASDSKFQDSGLALSYRLSNIETKLATLEENAMNEISHLKATLSHFSQSVREVVENNQGIISEEQHEQLFQKLQDLEARILNLDDIFSEQKMLNDELAKSFEENSHHSDELSQIVNQENQKTAEYVQALENKIVKLEEQLASNNMKFEQMEEQLAHINSKFEQLQEFSEAASYKMEELHSELEIAHGKILELDNIESLASLAAAKVIREEIIPLLNEE